MCCGWAYEHMSKPLWISLVALDAEEWKQFELKHHGV